MRKFITLLAFVLLWNNLLRGDEVWVTLNGPTFKSGKFSTRTHTHWRFPDDGFLRYARVSQKFSYKYNDTWTFGLHPTLEESRRASDLPWRQTRRLDFEANPRFKIGEMSVRMRNRFEVRWREGRGSETFNRFRHQTGLSWKANWLPGMTSIGVAEEIFYDFDADRISANWLYPIQLSFEPFEKFSCSIAYQIASSNRGGGDWDHTNVLALGGSFSF